MRRIRVFDREGVLQATSEDIDGLEHSLCWKPSGSVIATTQRLPNKHIVAFVEKNGLKHGEFKLPFSVDQVKFNEFVIKPDQPIYLCCRWLWTNWLGIRHRMSCLSRLEICSPMRTHFWPTHAVTTTGR